MAERARSRLTIHLKARLSNTRGPDFDPFEVQQVAHIEPLPKQGQPLSEPRPPVPLADPFEEAAWSAPLQENQYAPTNATAIPVDEKESATETVPTSNASRFSFTQTGQLELLTPSDQHSASDQEDAEGYAKSAQEWRPKPLDQLTINISEPAGVTPRDYAADRPIERWPCDPTLATRCWPMLTYQWAATCLCYQPLYFEEINLERYGYGCCGCLQSAASAAHFFGTVPILPYCMAVNCPGECNYVLGQYRPGSCAPWRTTCPGPNCRGGLAEAGTVVGLVLLIP